MKLFETNNPKRVLKNLGIVYVHKSALDWDTHIYTHV